MTNTTVDVVTNGLDPLGLINQLAGQNISAMPADDIMGLVNQLDPEVKSKLKGIVSDMVGIPIELIEYIESKGKGDIGNELRGIVAYYNANGKSLDGYFSTRLGILVSDHIEKILIGLAIAVITIPQMLRVVKAAWGITHAILSPGNAGKILTKAFDIQTHPNVPKSPKRTLKPNPKRATRTYTRQVDNNRTNTKLSANTDAPATAETPKPPAAERKLTKAQQAQAAKYNEKVAGAEARMKNYTDTHNRQLEKIEELKRKLGLHEKQLAEYEKVPDGEPPTSKKLRLNNAEARKRVIREVKKDLGKLETKASAMEKQVAKVAERVKGIPKPPIVAEIEAAEAAKITKAAEAARAGEASAKAAKLTKYAKFWNGTKWVVKKAGIVASIYETGAFFLYRDNNMLEMDDAKKEVHEFNDDEIEIIDTISKEKGIEKTFIIDYVRFNNIDVTNAKERDNFKPLDVPKDATNETKAAIEAKNAERKQALENHISALNDRMINTIKTGLDGDYEKTPFNVMMGAKIGSERWGLVLKVDADEGSLVKKEDGSLVAEKKLLEQNALELNKIYEKDPPPDKEINDYTIPAEYIGAWRAIFDRKTGNFTPLSERTEGKIDERNTFLFMARSRGDLIRAKVHFETKGEIAIRENIDQMAMGQSIAASTEILHEKEAIARARKEDPSDVKTLSKTASFLSRIPIVGSTLDMVGLDNLVPELNSDEYSPSNYQKRFAIEQYSSYMEKHPNAVTMENRPTIQADAKGEHEKEQESKRVEATTPKIVPAKAKEVSPTSSIAPEATEEKTRMQKLLSFLLPKPNPPDPALGRMGHVTPHALRKPKNEAERIQQEKTMARFSPDVGMGIDVKRPTLRGTIGLVTAVQLSKMGSYGIARRLLYGGAAIGLGAGAVLATRQNGAASVSRGGVVPVPLTDEVSQAITSVTQNPNEIKILSDIAKMESAGGSLKDGGNGGGVYQFTPSTAAANGLRDRKDVIASTEAALRYVNTIEDGLNAHGIPVTPLNIYLGWQQGVAGFAEIYNKRPSEVTKGRMINNPAFKGSGTDDPEQFIAEYEEAFNIKTSSSAVSAPVAAPVTTSARFGLSNLLGISDANASETPTVTDSPLLPPEERNFSYNGLNTTINIDNNAPYGETATKEKEPFTAIIIHHTGDGKSIDETIKDSHKYDDERKGFFGYHFYIDTNGAIHQAAPMDKRTNHIKPKNKQGVANKNAIGISLVNGENGATEEQIKSTNALVDALNRKYNISRSSIYGHGELGQKNKMASEGRGLAKSLRGKSNETTSQISSNNTSAIADNPSPVATTSTPTDALRAALKKGVGGTATTTEKVSKVKSNGKNILQIDVTGGKESPASANTEGKAKPSDRMRKILNFLLPKPNPPDPAIGRMGYVEQHSVRKPKNEADAAQQEKTLSRYSRDVGMGIDVKRPTLRGSIGLIAAVEASKGGAFRAAALLGGTALALGAMNKWGGMHGSNPANDDSLISPSGLRWKGGENKNVDANTLGKAARLQAMYPDMLVTEGFAPPGHYDKNGKWVGHVSKTQHVQHKALDVKLTGDNSAPRRAQFIRDASMIGFTGIGAYNKGTQHIDTRDNIEAWGNDTSGKSIDNMPSPIAQALREHLAKRGGGRTSALIKKPATPNDVIPKTNRTATATATAKPVVEPNQISQLVSEIRKRNKPNKQQAPIVVQTQPPSPTQRKKMEAVKPPKNYDSGLDKWLATLTA